MRFTSNAGIVFTFTVRYETLRRAAADEHQPVVRDESAHGRPHRDLLDAHGENVGEIKAWLPKHMSLNEALSVAIENITRNWQTYRGDFLGRPS